MKNQFDAWNWNYNESKVERFTKRSNRSKRPLIRVDRGQYLRRAVGRFGVFQRIDFPLDSVEVLPSFL